MPTPASVMEKPAAVMQAEKLSIIMFSGTADKFIPLGVLAQAAAAMDVDVNIFVTGFALRGFTKQHQDLPFPAEFAAMAPALQKGMQQSNVPSWDTMLREAKELGAKVGDVIELWATDAGVKSDVRAWAAKTRNEVMSVDDQGDKIVSIIRILRR